MTYVTKKCPHCGKYISVWQTKGKYIGSPFRTCFRCGKHYADTDFVEIAFLDKSEYEAEEFQLSNIWFLLSGLMELFLGVLALLYNIDSAVFILAIGLLSMICAISDIYKDYKTYQSRCKARERDLEASRHRVSNPAYIAALISIGIDVPAPYRKLLEDAQQSGTES